MSKLVLKSTIKNGEMKMSVKGTGNNEELVSMAFQFAIESAIMSGFTKKEFIAMVKEMFDALEEEMKNGK